MKRISFACLGLGLFAVTGCAAGESVWSRDSYVPPQQTLGGSQTYSPKTVVSPYQNNAQQQFQGAGEFSSGGSGTSNSSGSGSR